MKDFFNKIWYFVRYFKPIRTFWQTLSALLAVAAVPESVGLSSIDWQTALSAAALAAVISFVTLMAGDDTFWTSKNDGTLKDLDDAEA